ncbi:MAG: helix-turn-helix domain-containing protein [Eubacterium sp.]|nr:helix-turn-helix domain-containing protein [Eubacterium sp.]
MITNQLLQHTLDGIGGITGKSLYVFDTQANVLAQTDSEGSSYADMAKSFTSSEEDTAEISGAYFTKIHDDGELCFILVVSGDSAKDNQLSGLTAFTLSGLLDAYRQKYDKEDFIKNLLLDNLLLVDIMNRSQKLHITMRARRVVFLVEADREKDSHIMEIIRSIFSGTGRDFITAVDEKDIIIVKELGADEDQEDIEQTAEALVDMLNTEVMVNARVSYGTIINEIKEVSKSYKEAKMALDVGNIFYRHRTVIAYSNLGIGRLIYQLPLPLCKMFISEIFGTDEVPEFDEETLTTIRKFFENNLNVSKTSRELYIHRNTLVYRLEKLNAMTNLDINVFDDAITFEIALMVIEYMKYLDSISY